MLWKRILSGGVGIPLALYLIYAGGVQFTTVVTAVALIGLHEFIVTLRSKDVEIVKEVAYPTVAVIVLSPHLLRRADLGLLYATVLLVLVAGSLAFHVVVAPTFNPSPDMRFQFGALLSAGAATLATMYVSLFAFFIMMRKLTEPKFNDLFSRWEMEAGARLMLLVLLATWSVDAGAYFAGRALGRHPLAPRISPGKTIEAAIAGWCVGLLVTIALTRGFGFPMKHGAAMGIILGFAGQLGDLCKSVMKRDIGVKDFGNVIPGHGGVIDRFDSLLFNVPLVYLYAVSWMGMR